MARMMSMDEVTNNAGTPDDFRIIFPQKRSAKMVSGRPTLRISSEAYIAILNIQDHTYMSIMDIASRLIVEGAKHVCFIEDETIFPGIVREEGKSDV